VAVLRPWLVLAVIGALVLAGAVAGAVRPEIPRAEQTVFRIVNRLPGWLYWVLWLPMQLGNLVVGTAAGLVVALVQRDWQLAVAVVSAMALKLVSERIVRKRMQPYLAVRQRPGTSEPGAILRGADVPTSGPSFPSGHVILVAGVGAVVTTGLPAEWVWVPWLLAALVALGRVYVGAHNPLDVTAGLGAGMLVGALLAIPFG
jgi:membrane-associated phospholipid phosphatase